MIYSRLTLMKKGYQKGGSSDAADFEGKISKFDKKFVRPFLDELKILFEKHKLKIIPEHDLNMVIVDYDDFRICSSADVDVQLLKIEEKKLDVTV